jgi:hypothetical protein
MRSTHASRRRRLFLLHPSHEPPSQFPQSSFTDASEITTTADSTTVILVVSDA